MAATAVATLKNAELGAIRGVRSFYTGSGKPNQQPTKLSGNLKRRGAIITILLFLFSSAAFLASSNSFLMSAISNRFAEVTDVQYASAKARSIRLFSYYLNNTGATAKTWTGAQKYTHMSKAFQERLAKQGIVIEGSGSNKTLTYTRTTPSGGTMVVSNITANDFNKVYHENVYFRDAYNNAKYNRAGLYYDNTANKVLSKLGITRNLFKDYKQTNDAEANRTKYNETMSKKFNGDTTDIRTSAYYEEEREDENGNKYIHRDKADLSTDAITEGADIDAAKGKATDFLNKVGASTVHGLSTGISYPCMLLRIGNMISMTIAANEIYQSINYFTGMSESISKTIAGRGNNSAINEVLNFLSTSATTEVADLDNIQINGPSDDLKATSGTIRQTGSPLESNGMQMVLANAKANPKTTKNYSLERISNSTIPALATSGATMTGCAAADLTGSILSIGVEIVSGGLSKVATNIAGRVLYGLLLTGTVTAFFGFLVPTIAQTLFTNAFETATGIPAGEMFARGGSAANGRLARNGSGLSVSSRETSEAYNHLNNSILALDAETDRVNYSPFDINNPNTFFGSIAHSLLPTITSSSISNVASLMKSTASSLGSLMGSVNASGEGSSYMTTYGECPALESIGVAGDIYCNPIIAVDASTIDLPPTDEKYQQVIHDAMKSGSCDEEGNGCQIQEDSDLAKYITFCDGRDSPFGVADQNILSALQPTSEVSGALHSFLSSLPFVGDLMSLAESGADIKNIDWATGEKCGNTEQNSEWWNEKGKYYQRYIEDTRLLENIGAFDSSNTSAASQNPVTAYEEAYEAAHPTDNSYVGYLSRISGLTPENTETMLAYIDYFQYLNEYDPSSRIALRSNAALQDSSHEAVAQFKRSSRQFKEANSVSPSIALAPKYITYADVRNRTQTA